MTRRIGSAGAPSPGAPPSPNQPPTVVLITPVDGAQIPIGGTVTFTAAAADPDGAIKMVEFWIDGEKVTGSLQLPSP